MSKKLPTAVHEAAGTARSDRQSADEPRPDLGAPTMPVDFDEEEAKCWNSCVGILHDMGVLTVADGIALEQLVICILECRDLKQQVKSKPTVNVTSTQKEVVERANPLYAEWNRARDRLARLWSVFGLDPLARTSLHTVRTGVGKQSDGTKAKVGAGAKPKHDYYAH
jgi:P27 family predicted phage terminase small subunit